MKNIPFIQNIKTLFKKFHIHSFNKPIISRYISFNTRDIIYECKCGKRILKNVYRNYGEATTPFLEKHDMERILNIFINK